MRVGLRLQNKAENPLLEGIRPQTILPLSSVTQNKATRRPFLRSFQVGYGQSVTCYTVFGCRQNSSRERSVPPLLSHDTASFTAPLGTTSRSLARSFTKAAFSCPDVYPKLTPERCVISPSSLSHVWPCLRRLDRGLLEGDGDCAAGKGRWRSYSTTLTLTLTLPIALTLTLS